MPTSRGYLNFFKIFNSLCHYYDFAISQVYSDTIATLFPSKYIYFGMQCIVTVNIDFICQSNSKKKPKVLPKRFT